MTVFLSIGNINEVIFAISPQTPKPFSHSNSSLSEQKKNSNLSPTTNHQNPKFHHQSSIAMASSAFLTRVTTHFLKPLISIPSKPTARLFHATSPTPATDSGEPKFSDHLRQMYESFEFEKHPYMTAGPVKYCNVEEDDDALYARLDMPGISKEGLKVWVEEKGGSTLFITGDEGKCRAKYMAEEERMYSTNIAVPRQKYRNDQIKAVLKNGVLRIVVPKVKEEEKTAGGSVVNITTE